LLQAMHENGVSAPAVFISGLPGDDVEVRAFALGAADFIRKPVTNSVLLARVAKVLKES
jgi:FixJ family two-component response regulator